MKLLETLLLTIFLTPAFFGQNSSEWEKVQKMAELFVSAYNTKNYLLIEQQFNERVKTIVSAKEIKDFYDNLHNSSGKIVLLGKPAFFDGAIGIYPIDFERGKKELLIALNEAGKIRGLEINEKKEKVSRNKTKLILPFRGEWSVENGGDTVEQNYHQSISLSRFAFDFMKVDKNGKKYKGDGKKNEDYYSFGQKIISPAYGVVTDVITGVRDNEPGILNNFADIGNMVMIRHLNGEVSIFAHLKLGSTLVRVGQKVKKGQTVGLCGNSGNSDEPHLHYQLQETNIPTPESTIKVYFEKVMLRRDGKIEERNDYSPIKNDIIRKP